MIHILFRLCFKNTAQAILGIMMLSITASINTPTWAAAESTQWSFRALLDDQLIGHHHFTVQQNDQQRVLESEARFEVKLLFLSVYQYEHRASERWIGNCLQEISAQTADNGEIFSLNGKKEQASFIVSTAQGQDQLPDCVMSFAYWNPAILQQTTLLNPQTGDYEPVSVQYMGQDPLTLNNESVQAKRYELRTPKQHITLWYSVEDYHWLGLEAQVEGGYTLRYELAAL